MVKHQALKLFNFFEDLCIEIENSAMQQQNVRKWDIYIKKKNSKSSKKNTKINDEECWPQLARINQVNV